MTSYPTAQFRRPALAPGLIAAIALLAGAGFIGSTGFLWVNYLVSVLAIIIGYFSLQARQWWWLFVMIPIAVAWNPVVPIPWSGPIWQAAQFVAALALVTAGVLVKVAPPDDRGRRG